MPNQVERAAGTVLKVDGVVVAKITSIRRTSALSEEDVTGTEDVSGALVQEQFIAVAIGDTVAIEGISKSGEGEGTPQELEPGQQDLRDKMRAGTEVEIEHVKPSGFGTTMTGYLTNYEEGFSGVKGVYTFSAAFRMNSEVPVTP